MKAPSLTASDQAMLEGEEGQAVALAMRIVTRLAEASGAERLIDITAAHIDGCLYIGQASLDFAARLRDLGGLVRVPTTLNVSSLDLLHPNLVRADESTKAAARATMQAYEDMGCRPTWTCAPYQLEQRPARGERVAWAESNAIVFANSVLGARTERFGDFVDISAALTGRVPEAGLYLDENRLAGRHYDVSSVPADLRATEEFFAVLGLYVGRQTGRAVPVITGVEAADEDMLKVMGAAAATTGPVALIHVVGVTPEAPTLGEATGGKDTPTVEVGVAELAAARQALSSSAGDGDLASVHLGTPHYSLGQIARLAELLDGRSVHQSIRLYVNTGRDVLASTPHEGPLTNQGVVFVADTCTYVTPIIATGDGIAMSDSAKWVYYAPANIGADALFASTADCVESAVAGRVVRDDRAWQ